MHDDRSIAGGGDHVESDTIGGRRPRSGVVERDDRCTRRESGAGNVFICASPAKAYDTDENQVLVHALGAIRDAARAADPTGHSHGDDDVIRHARYNGTRAIRALDHRTLASVRHRRARPRGRMQKARAGMRARNYRTAVAVIERRADPVDAST